MQNAIACTMAVCNVAMCFCMRIVSPLREMVDDCVAANLLIDGMLCDVQSKQSIGQLVGCGHHVRHMSRSCSSHQRRHHHRMTIHCCSHSSHKSIERKSVRIEKWKRKEKRKRKQLKIDLSMCLSPIALSHRESKRNLRVVGNDFFNIAASMSTTAAAECATESSKTTAESTAKTAANTATQAEQFRYNA